MMNYSQAIEYIHSFKPHNATPGLERIRALLEKLGNPQKGLLFLHVAGTNGKGSTCTMLANVLHKTGRKVGLFTSPFIYDFRERFTVDGEMISRELLADLTQRVKDAAEGIENLTEFEIVTAIGMLYFNESGCDVTVLEVGLGGRFDATNVIEKPLASVICTVSLDHTEYLGDTVEKVAFEKAGIIKEGCPVVVYNSNPQEAMDVIRKRCAELSAPLSVGGQAEVLSMDINGSRFTYEGEEYTLNHLRGAHQVRNAVTVLETIKVLPFPVPQEAIREGLRRAGIPSRLEFLHKDPFIFVDGGHNKEGIDCLVQAMDSIEELKDPVIIFGMMKDKPYQYAVRQLASRARAFLTVQPPLPRAMTAYDLKNMGDLFCDDCFACDNYNQAARLALEKGGTVLVAGSLYLAGDMATELKNLL